MYSKERTLRLVRRHRRPADHRPEPGVVTWKPRRCVDEAVRLGRDKAHPTPCFHDDASMAVCAHFAQFDRPVAARGIPGSKCVAGFKDDAGFWPVISRPSVTYGPSRAAVRPSP